MKNHLSKLILGLFIFFSFANFVSAGCGPKTYNDYNSLDTNDGVIFIMSQPSDFYYTDNYYDSDRHSTYEYRNGYTYRTTNEYYMHNQGIMYYNDEINLNSNYAIYQKYPNQYYVYNDYMNTYQKQNCYIYPPRNQLFYVKCPGY